MFLKISLRLLLILSVGLSAVLPATAATYEVDTLDDTVQVDGLVSLREAILAANGSPANADTAAGDDDGDTIGFAAALSGTINLDQAQGELTITDDVSIDGALRIVVDAGSNSRIATLNTSGAAGSQSTVAISNLTLQNGTIEGNGGLLRIMPATTATLDVVALKSGVANETDPATQVGDGGAIWNAGTVTISRSSVSDSTATNLGGAIYNGANATLTAVNSTFSKNSALRGGAVYAAHTNSATGEITLLHVTASENTAGVFDGGGALFIDGDGTTSATNTVLNSMLAGNTATAGEGEDPCNDASGAVTIESSVISDTCDELTATQRDSSAFTGFFSGRLSAVRTHPDQNTVFYPVISSPGLDRAAETECNDARVGSVDQRNQGRPFQANSDSPSCDIGAYERQDNARLVLPFSQSDDAGQVVSVDRGNDDALALTLQLTNNGSSQIDISELSGQITGNGNFETELENIRLIQDTNNNGTYEAASDVTVLAFGNQISIDATNKLFTVTPGSAIPLAANSSMTVFLVVDVVTNPPAAAFIGMLPAFLLLPLLGRLRKVWLVLLTVVGLSACGGSSAGDPVQRPATNSTTFQFILTGITATERDSGDVVILVQQQLEDDGTPAVDSNNDPILINAENRSGPLLTIIEAAATPSN